MKTILSQIKTTLRNSTTLRYVNKIEIVSPKLLPDISSSLLPYIGIAPVSTSESWIAQQKEAVHSVDVYAVIWLQIPESAILGDSVKKGMLEVVDDISSVLRGERLLVNSNYYLSKPIEITNIDYVVAQYGDNAFLLVADISLRCVRRFALTLP